MKINNMEVEFEFEGRCVVRLKHEEGNKTSAHVATNFNLDVSNNLERSLYLDADDLPTETGTKALTICFVQGLVGNIHAGHQKGFWNDVEHLKYIIAELEKGFAQVAQVKESKF